jgi:putative transposase
MIEQTVEELTPIVGTRPACRALGAAPATIYRRRRPPTRRPPGPRPRPARALSDAEREAVLAELHSERFVDCSPAQVYATLLDEGRYLASERTMYRLLSAAHGSVRSGATSSPTRRTRSRSCSLAGRTSSGRGTSRS